MRVRGSMRALALAAVVLVCSTGSAIAKDKWFVIGQKTLNSTDASAEVTAEGGKLLKEDIKKTKISVEGADVDISKVTFRWNNRPDEIIYVGTVKSGGETAPKDAPGREATLTGAAVQYKILNNAPSATLKLWGYD